MPMYIHGHVRQNDHCPDLKRFRTYRLRSRCRRKNPHVLLWRNGDWVLNGMSQYKKKIHRPRLRCFQLSRGFCALLACPSRGSAAIHVAFLALVLRLESAVAACSKAAQERRLACCTYCTSSRVSALEEEEKKSLCKVHGNEYSTQLCNQVPRIGAQARSLQIPVLPTCTTAVSFTLRWTTLLNNLSSLSPSLLTASLPR